MSNKERLASLLEAKDVEEIIHVIKEGEDEKMKFAAVCGSGLGSSFMVEMNINSVLNDLGVSGVEVAHYDLGSAAPELADVFLSVEI